MTKLEQSFADIAAAHNLVNVSLDCTRSDERTYFHFSMQWLDPSDTCHGRGIAGASADTIAEAMDYAMQAMAKKRGASVTIADEALPESAA